jgi:hypothetical protein
MLTMIAAGFIESKDAHNSGWGTDDNPPRVPIITHSNAFDRVIVFLLPILCKENAGRFTAEPCCRSPFEY